MRRQFGTILAAACGIGGVALLSLPAPARADEPALAETATPCVYSADTRGAPYAVKTAGDLSALWSVTCRAGETVTLVSPSGARTTLVDAAPAATRAALPLNAGGVWTVENSAQGSATFTVRHALYGTQGAGTADSPAKVVDGEELVDSAAGDGYVFVLEPVDGLLGALAVPPGCRLEEAGGAWRLVTSSDGSLYVGPPVVYLSDSVAEGPNRRTVKREALPVAYSGDDWAGDVTKAALLTFVAPGGAETTLELAGTGATSFRFTQAGDWTVRLTMADGTTRTAVISIWNGGTIVICR